MGALTPLTPWITKDDLLLKESIEAGASLESLAKGAVQFSRRFSIKELQDRWHDLLYHPVASAEASARLVVFMRSSRATNSTKADSSNEAKYGHRKRNPESIRRCYYAMRKRICNVSQVDLRTSVDPSDSCFITGADDPGPGDPMPVDYGIEKVNFDDSHKVFPDVIDGAPPYGSQNTLEDYLADLSESLFSCSSDDEMLITDGVKDAIAKKYFEDLSSLLFNSSDDLLEDAMPGLPGLEKPAVVDEHQGVASITGEEEEKDGEITLEHSCATNGSNYGFQMPISTATVSPGFPELLDGVICCFSNTEVPEIPRSDHHPFCSKAHSEANKLSFAAENCAGTQKMTKREAKWIVVQNPASYPTNVDTELYISLDDSEVKFVAPRGEIHNSLCDPNPTLDGLCRSSLTVNNEPSCKVLEKSSQISAISLPQTCCGETNQEGIALSSTCDEEFSAVDFVDNSAASGGEPLVAEEEQFYESDSNIPYFSDIESMILDMDLGPDDQDYVCSSEVTKYKPEDVNREIIRLDQNAHSCTQRAVASHGAFAILYGRHSKHYIKKPQVLLGRGTDVDIDLGREGLANKISRRQATIKMEKNGTFSLKNMGKHSIYLNGAEVSSGLTLNLQSSCLMEIRGVPFIFETYRASVKKYLDKAVPKADSRRPTFDY